MASEIAIEPGITKCIDRFLSEKYKETAVSVVEGCRTIIKELATNENKTGMVFIPGSLGVMLIKCDSKSMGSYGFESNYQVFVTGMGSLHAQKHIEMLFYFIDKHVQTIPKEPVAGFNIFFRKFVPPGPDVSNYLPKNGPSDTKIDYDYREFMFSYVSGIADLPDKQPLIHLNFYYTGNPENMYVASNIMPIFNCNAPRMIGQEGKVLFDVADICGTEAELGACDPLQIANIAIDEKNPTSTIPYVLAAPYKVLKRSLIPRDSASFTRLLFQQAGESLIMKYVCRIDFKPPEDSPADSKPLGELQKTLINVIKTTGVIIRECNYCKCNSLHCNLKRCSKCKKIWYCGLACQRKDSDTHSEVCIAGQAS